MRASPRVRADPQPAQSKDMGGVNAILTIVLILGLVWLATLLLGAGIASHQDSAAQANAVREQARTAAVQAQAEAKIEHSADRRVEFEAFLAFLAISSPTRSADGLLLPLLLGVAIGLGAVWLRDRHAAGKVTPQCLVAACYGAKGKRIGETRLRICRNSKKPF